MFKKFLLCIVLTGLLSCKKDNVATQKNTTVPFARVNTSVNNQGFISAPGTHFIIPKNGNTGITGIGGIIVYNLDNTTITGSGTFVAYDLACPYVSQANCDTPMQYDGKTRDLQCVDCANDDVKFGLPFKNTVEINGEIFALRRYIATLENGAVRIRNL